MAGSVDLIAMVRVREHEELTEAIAAGTDPHPTFADGLQVQRVLAAVEQSSSTRTWQEIPA